ncbi:MAG: helix-turn-helix transcriptional regulator [Clostridia bacterium]|nr:helix-turn-helix transcriptional regulator [Clostridia bacterium]
MFKNKTAEGKNNICGNRIYELRKAHIPKMSQRILAEKMQLLGIDLDKNAIQRIECGQRFITDIEIVTFARVFGVSCDNLLSYNEQEND